MSGEEAERYLRFMKFPNVLDLDDYRALLDERGCTVEAAEDTGRFASHVDLYLDMLNMQLTYDALKRIGFDMALMEALGGEMGFIQQLAHDQKICQGRFVATKQLTERAYCPRTRIPQGPNVTGGKGASPYPRRPAEFGCQDETRRARCEPAGPPP